MGDWIGLAVIGSLVVGAVAFLIYLSRPYEITTEEFEKRAAEAPSLLSAGFVGLQKILDPATTKAVIAQEDFKQGRFDAKQAKGDGDEAGNEKNAEGDEQTPARTIEVKAVQQTEGRRLRQNDKE